MRLIIAPVLCAVLLLGGCDTAGPGDSADAATTSDAGAGASDVDGPSATRSPVTTSELAGRVFGSVGATGHELVPGSRIWLSFHHDGELGVYPGCNWGRGTWRAEDGTLVIPGRGSRTLRACERTLMDQDSWTIRFLGSRPSITLDGTHLELSKDGATLSLEEQLPTALVGTAWRLEGVRSNSAFQWKAESDSGEAGITLPDETSLQLDTGCNTGRTSVSITEVDRAKADSNTSSGALEIGPATLTRQACASKRATTLERYILAVLEGSATFAITGTRLTIRNDQKRLSFVAE